MLEASEPDILLLSFAKLCVKLPPPNPLSPMLLPKLSSEGGIPKDESIPDDDEPGDPELPCPEPSITMLSIYISVV